MIPVSLSPRPDWIAVDWGTTHMRAWAMAAGGDVLAQVHVDAGMGKLAPDQFETVLLDAVAPWLDPNTEIPVMACGMVGARQGWIEAAYSATPCRPLGDAPPCRAPTRDGRIAVSIIGGIMQADPPDVMRGEETQLAGLLASHANFEGTVCLPGTHTKWVQIAGGRIISFATMMTGEVFALLSTQSVLRHSMTEGTDETAFEEAASATLNTPDAVAARLFSIRANSLLGRPVAGAARSRLSGLLIGGELAAMRHWWSGRSVTIIGAGTLAALYARALGRAGAMPTIADGDAMTIAGITAAYRQTRETAS